MSSSVLQLLVLAAIAVFLIVRLRNVLGSREGFEKPPVPRPVEAEDGRPRRRDFAVIEGGQDRDITDHVPDGSPSARALGAMKQAEPSFSVSDFLRGARSAYEMILMSFEKGDMSAIRSFLSDDVAATFAEVIEAREKAGLTVEANFVGLRELTLQEASFDHETREAEIAVRFVGELTSVARDRTGTVVEGSPSEIRRQRDVWTFARSMGAADPNWTLVATGE